MNDRVLIEPEAERDLFAALDWYQSTPGDLGIEFLDAFWSLAAALSANPGIGRIITTSSDGTPIRRFPMARFPYAVVYVEVRGQVRVLAVAHGRRRPEFWRGRLKH